MKSALTVVLFLLFAIGVCVDGNEESVSVTEGDSVTLKSGVTEIQTDDGIEWRFNGTRIAKISSDSSEIWVKPDGSFRDRLKLDSQTGDLKISNIRTTDSGQYKLKISRRKDPPPEMIFTVKVTDALKSVSVKEGETVTLPITEIQKDDLIQWMFEDTVLAEINKADQRFYTSNGPDGRFRARLNLDHQTGSLIITNTRTTHSGLYELKISSSRRTMNRRIIVIVTAVPDPGWSSAALAGIGVGVGGVCFLLGAAAVVIYYRCKRSRDERRENESQQLPDYCSDEGKSAGSGPKSIQKRNLTADYSADAKKLFKNQLQPPDYCSELDELSEAQPPDYCSELDELSEAQPPDYCSELADYCSDEDELSEAQLYERCENQPQQDSTYSDHFYE